MQLGQALSNWCERTSKLIVQETLKDAPPDEVERAAEGAELLLRAELMKLLANEGDSRAR